MNSKRRHWPHLIVALTIGAMLCPCLPVAAADVAMQHDVHGQSMGEGCDGVDETCVVECTTAPAFELAWAGAPERPQFPDHAGIAPSVSARAPPDVAAPRTSLDDSSASSVAVTPVSRCDRLDD